MNGHPFHIFKKEFTTKEEEKRESEHQRNCNNPLLLRTLQKVYEGC